MVLFAGDVRFDSAKLLLQLVQNPVHGRFSTREEAQLLLNPLRQTCIGIQERGESKLTKSVPSFCFDIFSIFLLASELLMTDPRTRAPCVISTFVPAHTVDAWRSPPGLIIIWHFGGSTWYPYLGPSWVSLSKSALISFKLPTMLPSSAYHFGVKESLWSLVIRGTIAIPYLANARGSPYVVLFWGRMADLPMWRWDGWL